MNAEIIAIGSELLLGQITNTNAQYLSEELAVLGVNVFFHTTVGDNPERLALAIEQAQKRSDLIIFTGGLGPTKDDLTKETLAKLLQKKLVMNEGALEKIKSYFTKTKREMSENNKKQAVVIEGSDVLPNDVGMAPGMALKHEEKIYMLFPGPPKELTVMFQRYGCDYILNLLEKKEYIQSRVLRFFGIGESKLETEIIDLIDGQSNPTIAPLAVDGEVTLRLTAKHESIEVTKTLLDELEDNISNRVGDYLYGYGDSSLAETLFVQLSKENNTMASAESLTGGLFSECLTRFSGASKIVKGGVICYTNEIKERILDIKPVLLKKEGAVSKECARLMAENVREKFNSDIGISFTGVAGPSESEGKPVGTVYIGIAWRSKETQVYQLTLAGTRTTIRHKAMKYGLFYLLNTLNHKET